MLRHRWMVTALGFAALLGCSATRDRRSQAHPGPTRTPRNDLLPANALRSRLVGFHEPRRSDRDATRNKRPRDPFKKTWHLDIAVRTAGAKLASSKQKLDRRLDLPLKLDVLGVFDDPTTPLDRRSDLGLNTIALGFGRSESEYFGWNVYGGFGFGAERNHQSFLVSTLDVNFQYAVYYTGFTGEYYPWTMPLGSPKMTWSQRFRRSRPYFVGGFEVGFVNAEADGDLTIASATIYKDGQTIRDWLFSIPVGVGWAIPINDRWSLQTVLDYRFHFYRPEEYNGWTLAAGLRWRL